MLKKAITYTNIDGVTVTDNFYFNMTKAELIKLELSEDEGMQAKIERIQRPDAKGREVIEVFDSILRQSYGVRTDDGRFIKRPEYFEEFLASEAYSELLFSITTNAGAAAEFVTAVMPKVLQSEIEAELANRVVQDVVHNVPDYNTERAKAGLQENPENMSEADLMAGLGIGRTTDGYTDDEIRSFSPAVLSKKSREVLVRAYQLKNQQ